MHFTTLHRRHPERGEFNPNITYAAVRFWGEGNDLVDNAGTITAEQGRPSPWARGDDTVILRSGSKISGSVDGDDADDTDPELVNGTADRIFLDGRVESRRAPSSTSSISPRRGPAPGPWTGTSRMQR